MRGQGVLLVEDLTSLARTLWAGGKVQELSGQGAAQSLWAVRSFQLGT